MLKQRCRQIGGLVMNGGALDIRGIGEELGRKGKA
ncbi:UNVERIFIED_ORG: hypothetical protein GGD47_004622 [Rhizobium etli]